MAQFLIGGKVWKSCLMLFLLSIFMAIGFAAGIYTYWQQVDDTKEGRTHYISWAIRGIGGPVLVWMVFNANLLSKCPSFFPTLDRTKTFSHWLSLYQGIVGLGIFIITTYWAAVTCTELLFLIHRETKQKSDFNGVFNFWILIFLPITVISIYCGGWAFLGAICSLWFITVIHFTVPLVHPFVPAPSYTKAIVKIFAGKYEDAENEVIHELEKHENDFDGWLMLADLYATHFGDLPAADRTIHEMCQDPSVTVSQISVALNHLADWYLKIGHDPESAHRALEEICRRLPNTHLEHMARLRLKSIPRSKQELLDHEKVPTVKMPTLVKISDSENDVLPPDLAAAQANQYTEKLKRNPNDIPSRVALAKLLAEQLGKVDLALEQMELLLDMPQKTEKQAASWLNLMAEWQMRFHHDAKAAQKLWERLLGDYPNTVEAFTAQRRLAFLKQEIRTPRFKTFTSAVDT